MNFHHHPGSGDRAGRSTFRPTVASTTRASMETQPLVLPVRSAKSYLDELASLNKYSLVSSNKINADRTYLLSFLLI